MKTLAQLLILFFLTHSSLKKTMAQINYPVTAKGNVVDDYHGNIIADPYRWLEDDQSATTKEWISRQNAFTQSFLEKIPYRKTFVDRLKKIYNYPKYSLPIIKEDFTYFYKNDGLQNQFILYRENTKMGTIETVIDPNTFSADATIQLKAFKLSKNGNYAAYALSKGGSDWMEIFVMDMKTLKTLPEKIEWVKVSDIAWQGNGFYYSRYPEPKGSDLADKNENHQVWYHRLNRPQAQDQMIYQDVENPQRFHSVTTSEDESLAFLFISDRGKGFDGNALWLRPAGENSFQPIVKNAGVYSFYPIDYKNNVILIQTNQDAPNEKIMAFDLTSKTWIEFIPESELKMESASSGGKKIFVNYLKDVSTKVKVFDENGRFEHEIQLPGIGTASGFDGEKTDKDLYYVFSSFALPSSIFKYNISTQTSTPFRQPEIKFNSDDFETKQVFYPSKDGTQIPLFLTYKKGLVQNKKNPTILYGYGGFNISITPSFNPLMIPFLEQGGLWAVANLRGGSEYGEEWHKQGAKNLKQNVFDDFIGAAEYLFKENYTAPEKMALMGRSNGGLLIGAVVNQRPDLAKVAIPQVGVMDMLRFQKFTIGWNWIAEYGSSENPEEFKYLIQYSPLHTIKNNTEYPAVLITTADRDDRVVPAHSFKYASTLQEIAGSNSKNPLLIKIGTSSGHHASNTHKNIEDMADIFGFIFWNMNVKTLKKIE